jgi:hypothetical protein
VAGRELAALIVASALITLDGTAVTVALPAIGRGLHVSFSRLQWLGNAPLLTLAALLMPAGALADRCGRLRLMRVGLLIFGLSAVACTVATSDVVLIAARLLQGAGAALVLPGAVARLRAAYTDSAERTRKFGVWAAWTGVASALGPLLGGALADLLSWRAVFAVSCGIAIVALVLLKGAPGEPAVPGRPVPLNATIALTLFLCALAYLLIEGGSSRWTSPRLLVAAACALASLVWVVRAWTRQPLLPNELLTRPNCLSANSATFALYFGLFGVSFLLVLYTQQALGYSGVWAGVGILPVSLMLFLAEPFSRLTSRLGTRIVVAGGSALAAAGILWIAAGPEPLPFWTRIILGTALFGGGVSVAVPALTHAAVSALPEDCAAAASGLNHATVRSAGLLAIALLGSIAAQGASDRMSVDGFRRAMRLCGILVAAGGVVSGMRIREDEPGGVRGAA